MSGMVGGRLAIVGVALLLGAGCDLLGGPERWFPLEEGLAWRYRTELTRRKQTVDSFYRVLGPRKLDAVGREGIAVEEHRSTYPTMWNGPGEIELSLWVTDGEWMTRVYLQYDGDVLVPQIGFEDRHVLPKRLRDGLTWESTTVSVGDGETSGYAHRHRASRESAPVVVPAGRFDDCLRIDTESVLREAAPGKPEIVYLYREWYAPGVGLVRMDSWADRQRTDERSRTELLEWGHGLPGPEVPGKRSEAPRSW